MHIYIASDHAGFKLKKELLLYIGELGHKVEDCGAYAYDEGDDYPDFTFIAAKHVSENPENRAILLGGSGQGEAMVANRFKNVRAAVYYGPAGKMQTDASGETLNLIISTRKHNDANILCIGARFVSTDEAKETVALWLSTPFSKEERHVRRIKKINNTA